MLTRRRGPSCSVFRTSTFFQAVAATPAVRAWIPSAEFVSGVGTSAPAIDESFGLIELIDPVCAISAVLIEFVDPASSKRRSRKVHSKANNLAELD